MALPRGRDCCRPRMPRRAGDGQHSLSPLETTGFKVRHQSPRSGQVTCLCMPGWACPSGLPYPCHVGSATAAGQNLSEEVAGKSSDGRPPALPGRGGEPCLQAVLLRYDSAGGPQDWCPSLQPLRRISTFWTQPARHRCAGASSDGNIIMGYPIAGPLGKRLSREVRSGCFHDYLCRFGPRSTPQLVAAPDHRRAGELYIPDCGLPEYRLQSHRQPRGHYSRQPQARAPGRPQSPDGQKLGCELPAGRTSRKLSFKSLLLIQL